MIFFYSALDPGPLDPQHFGFMEPDLDPGGSEMFISEQLIKFIKISEKRKKIFENSAFV